MIARDPQFSDARAIARREFLRRLGLAGAAAGAGYLTLGGVAHAASGPGVAASPVILGRGASRPFHVLSLGDSAMWGQGLAEPQKYRNIVCDWLRANNTLKRDVRQFNYAHSGAIITHGPERDEEWKIAKSESWGGEIGREDPTVLRQVGMALDDLQREGIPPEDVDLVLMNGGANDVNFMTTLLNPDPFIDTPFVRRRIEDGFVGPRMGAVLPRVLDAFPNAKVILVGYYQAISSASPLVRIGALGSLVFGPLGLFATAGYLDETIRRNEQFVASIDKVYTTLAAQQGRGRTFHVASHFGLQNAVGARESFVWDLPDVDPVEQLRRQECLAIRGGNPAALLANAPTSGLRVDATLEYAGRVACDEANTFHPNPAGARHYAEVIIDKLTHLMPEWAGYRRMAVRVEGTPTGGGTAPFTVIATDSETGAPVSAVFSGAGLPTVPANTPTSIALCNMVTRTIVEDDAGRKRALPAEARSRVVSEREPKVQQVQECAHHLQVRAQGYVASYVKLDFPDSPPPSALAAERARQQQEADARTRAEAEAEARRRASAEEEARRAEAARQRDAEARQPRGKGSRPGAKP